MEIHNITPPLRRSVWIGAPKERERIEKENDRLETGVLLRAPNQQYNQTIKVTR